jgi:hypothetical protein
MITTLPEANSFRLAQFTALAYEIIHSEMKALLERHELYCRLRGISKFHEEVFQVSLKEIKRRTKNL